MVTHFGRHGYLRTIHYCSSAPLDCRTIRAPLPGGHSTYTARCLPVRWVVADGAAHATAPGLGLLWAGRDFALPLLPSLARAAFTPHTFPLAACTACLDSALNLLACLWTLPGNIRTRTLSILSGTPRGSTGSVVYLLPRRARQHTAPAAPHKEQPTSLDTCTPGAATLHHHTYLLRYCARLRPVPNSRFMLHRVARRDATPPAFVACADRRLWTPRTFRAQRQGLGIGTWCAGAGECRTISNLSATVKRTTNHAFPASAALQPPTRREGCCGRYNGRRYIHLPYIPRRCRDYGWQVQRWHCAQYLLPHFFWRLYTRTTPRGSPDHLL